MTDRLIRPHGGTLVNLLSEAARAEELRQEACGLPSWDLTPRQLCDLELMMNGAFSPLRGFLTRPEHESVCESMRLPDGDLWPIPVTLDVPEKVAEGLEIGKRIVLRDVEGYALAVLDVADVWEPDRRAEAEQVFGTTNPEHPAVAHLSGASHRFYVGGKIEGIARPRHFDFVELRLTPAQLRQKFVRLGWRRVAAYQTRNPMHRAHRELPFRAAAEIEANLLIHPVVGMTKPGDVDHYTRVRCYQTVLRHYPKNTAMMSLLPLAMRMGGPREALWHAIIRKNHGCTHLIVGRDHAGPGRDTGGEPFYGPREAQQLLEEHQDELGIRVVPVRMLTYVPDRDAYVPIDEVADGTRTLSIPVPELRERLARGREIPDWYSFPEVIEQLRRACPPRSRQGFTVFITGLSGAGKSTIAKALMVKLLEMGGRPVTLLDGDIVRKNLSSELGFSKEHRDINIRRIGFVASEITKNGGIAICAPIAPYDRVRKENKDLISQGGGYILVHVTTPIEVCEQRDVKGLYAKAHAGLIKEFTGVSDPYEVPEDADLSIDTSDRTPEECAQRIILHLEKEGYIGVPNG